MDGLFDEIEYHRQKKSMEWELESLLIPEVDAAKEAGRLLADMPMLWAGATLRERHQLLTTILDAVYIDMKGGMSIVSVKVKPAFHTVPGVAGFLTRLGPGTDEAPEFGGEALRGAQILGPDAVKGFWWGWGEG